MKLRRVTNLLVYIEVLREQKKDAECLRDKALQDERMTTSELKR
jgi:hypothetical protein